MTETLWLQITSARGPAGANTSSPALLPILPQLKRGPLASALSSVAAQDGDEGEHAALGDAGRERCSRGAGWPKTRWVGSVLWVGKSPYRPHHRRRNWFDRRRVLLACPVSPAGTSAIWNFRRCGPRDRGPARSTRRSRRLRPASSSGLSVVAREERSQAQNKRLALARLAALFAEQGTSRPPSRARALGSAQHAVARQPHPHLHRPRLPRATLAARQHAPTSDWPGRTARCRPTDQVSGGGRGGVAAGKPRSHCAELPTPIPACSGTSRLCKTAELRGSWLGIARSGRWLASARCVSFGRHRVPASCSSATRPTADRGPQGRCKDRRTSGAWPANCR